MNASIKTLAIMILSVAAAGAQVVSTAQSSSADVGNDTLTAACARNAGAFNSDEKAACIQVVTEGAAKTAYVHPVVAKVAACKAAAGAFNSDEKAGCIEAAIEQYSAYCAVAGAAMAEERHACIRVVIESASAV